MEEERTNEMEMAKKKNEKRKEKEKTDEDESIIQIMQKFITLNPFSLRWKKQICL